MRYLDCKVKHTRTIPEFLNRQSTHMPSADTNLDDYTNWPPTMIVTRYDPPPIPMRFFDWSATEDDYEPGRPIGYGVTEQDAVTHLLDQLQEMAT